MQRVLSKLSDHKMFFLFVLFVTALLLVFRLSTPNDHSLPDTTPHIQLYEKTIQSSLDYLDRTASDVSPLQWLVVDYLQRKFNLDSKFSAAQRNIQSPATEPDATDFQVYQRIIKPDKLLESLPITDLTPMRRMMISAAHCDYIPLPKDFEKLLTDNMKAGGYNLTHVAFSLQFMKDNGCSLPLEQDQQLREKVATRLSELAARADISEDLRYEAIAFLLHMDRRDLVQIQWINQTANAQYSDGGWLTLPQDTKSSDHTTVVALWVLLEYAHPDTPETPIIRRPDPAI